MKTLTAFLLSLFLFCVSSSLFAQEKREVIFRVQIGTAGKMPDENSKFKKDYADAEGVRLDDGMIRVYVGKYETYHEAKERLAEVTTKYPTAYVVGFYKGDRITVDKAMEIIYGD